MLSRRASTSYAVRKIKKIVDISTAEKNKKKANKEIFGTEGAKIPM